jgi:hypothetical protein
MSPLVLIPMALKRGADKAVTMFGSPRSPRRPPTTIPVAKKTLVDV